MSLLNMNGFEGEKVDTDGITIVTGSGPIYETSSLPAGSPSAHAARLNSTQTWTQPWIDGEQTGTRREPSGAEYWFHGRIRHANNNTSNDQCIYGTERNGSEHITISYQDSTNLITLRVAGAVVATAALWAPTITLYERIMVHVDQVDTGEINVYVDGNLATPVLTYTLDATDITNLGGKPNGNYWAHAGIGSDYIDDWWVMDPLDATGLVTPADLISMGIEGVPFTGDSPTYAQWTGAYTDINAVPFDANQIETGAVDQASTFTHNGSAEDLVLACCTKWDATRTGTDAGSNLQVRIREAGTATDKDETSTPAPGDGHIIQIHQTAPDGGAWDLATFNDTEFGLVSRT